MKITIDTVKEVRNAFPPISRIRHGGAIYLYNETGPIGVIRDRPAAWLDAHLNVTGSSTHEVSDDGGDPVVEIGGQPYRLSQGGFLAPTPAAPPPTAVPAPVETVASVPTHDLPTEITKEEEWRAAIGAAALGAVPGDLPLVAEGQKPGDYERDVLIPKGITLAQVGRAGLLASLAATVATDPSWTPILNAAAVEDDSKATGEAVSDG